MLIKEKHTQKGKIGWKNWFIKGLICIFFFFFWDAGMMYFHYYIYLKISFLTLFYALWSWLLVSFSYKAFHLLFVIVICISFRMGSWQYMTDMPYASVSLETTWKLMWMLHMGQNQLVSPDNLPPLEQCKAELKGEVLMATFLYKFFTIIFKKWVLILILLLISLSCKCFQENTFLLCILSHLLWMSQC